MVASILINIMVALCLLNNKVAQYESNVGAPMVALLAIWLHSLSMLTKLNVCTTSYGSAPGNMVASINLATAKKMGSAPGNMVASTNLATTKKNGCATSYGCASSYGSAPGNMVASVNLATAKKNGCTTSYGCATSYGCTKNRQNTDYKMITRGKQ